MKATIITFFILLTAGISTGLLVVFTGAFNVSAIWKEPVLLEWVLEETRENSIKKRAATIKPLRLVLNDKKQFERGFKSYREMCITCHSAPGLEPSPVAQGLNPPPPNLSKESEHEMSPEELFWVIKNGIRMTGMPAWGISHKDDEIRDIVAFLKVLPKISASDYKILDNSIKKGHGHSESSTEHTKQSNHNGNTAPTHKPATITGSAHNH